MDYRHKNAIESCIKKVHEQQGTLEKVQEMNDELEKTYDKAKAFDEINKILDVYLGNVEDELIALNLIREKLEELEDE